MFKYLFIYYTLKVFLNFMDINKNIKILNEFLNINSFLQSERYRIISIAKVSVDMNDLVENINWEFPYENIKL